jgi:hypothetical protein
MNEPLLCRFIEKPPLRAFDEKPLQWKAASMKSCFDEKLLHQFTNLYATFAPPPQIAPLMKILN